MLIDSHCHLDYFAAKKFGDELNLNAVLESAKQAGVEYCLSACATLTNFPNIVKIAEEYQNIFVSVGLHPNEEADNEPNVDELVKLADNPFVVGIGETGLDYHYRHVSTETQRERFRTHIRTAIKANKPLIVHTRSAKEDTLEIMQKENAKRTGGVMHCFSENWEMAQTALDLGFYISFSGIITFKKADEIREVAKLVPLDRILIETDAPYLAPTPYRSKPNQPAYVRFVAECLAEIKNVPFAKIAEQTSINFFTLFIQKP